MKIVDEIKSGEADIIEECLKRWKPDEQVADKLRETYLCWCSQMSHEILEIINKLLANFDYYSHAAVNDYLKKSHQRLMEDYDLELEYTAFVILPNQRGTLNSSVSYILEYQHINGISKYNIVLDFRDIIPYLEKIKTIICIDDFCGSGKTFLDFIKKYLEYLTGKNIYYVVIHTMQDAKNEIYSFSKENDVDINIISTNISDKAFSINYDLGNRKETFIRESGKIGIKSQYVLGFNGSEALVSFYNDTPNNTLGVFWKETSMNTPLFPRKNDKRPAWQIMNKNKVTRSASNYLKKVEK